MPLAANGAEMGARLREDGAVNTYVRMQVYAGAMAPWCLAIIVGSWLTDRPVAGWQVAVGLGFALALWGLDTWGRRWLRRRANPTPPANVRIVLPAQAREVPVDCRYVGTRLEPVHYWTTVTTTDVGRDLEGMHVAVDMLPPRTVVQVDMTRPKH